MVRAARNGGHVCRHFIRSECGCKEFPKDFAGIWLDYACGPRLMELLDYLERRAPVRGKAILRQLARSSASLTAALNVAFLRIAGGV